MRDCLDAIFLYVDNPCRLLIPREGIALEDVMARQVCRVRQGSERVPVPERRDCPAYGRRMRIRYENRRTVLTLNGFLSGFVSRSSDARTRRAPAATGFIGQRRNGSLPCRIMSSGSMSLP